MPLLEVTDLVKWFPSPYSRSERVWAVNGVSFAVEQGETLGLVGESGSGKTTVGRCLLGLIRPSSGSVLFDGEEVSGFKGKRRELRARVQIVFQEPYDSLDPRLTLGDSIAEPLRLARGLDREAHLARVRSTSAQVGLDEDELTRYPHEMSAGRLQRAGIARALVSEPQLIVLDEPTSLLDAEARADIIRLLGRLQQETGVAYIFISHDLTTVQHLSSEVAVMYLGKIVEHGQTAAVFEQPLHPYTRSLLSAVLPPDPDAERSTYELSGEIPSPIDLPSGCFLHSRCPVAIDACTHRTPELLPFAGQHSVSCIRVADEGRLPGEHPRMAEPSRYPSESIRGGSDR